MESKIKGNVIVRSALAGIGTTILFLLLGMVLDYIVTQVLSQFIIAGCSEDCYFRIFNSIFVVVVLLSLAGGILSGLRMHKRLSR